MRNYSPTLPGLCSTFPPDRLWQQSPDTSCLSGGDGVCTSRRRDSPVPTGLCVAVPLLCVCVNHYLRCLQHNWTSWECGAFVIHGGGGGVGGGGGDGRAGERGGYYCCQNTDLKWSGVGREVGPTARDLTSKRQWAAARRPPKTHAEQPKSFQAIKGDNTLIGDRAMTSPGGQAVNTPSSETMWGPNKVGSMGSRSEAITISCRSSLSTILEQVHSHHHTNTSMR